MIIERMPEIFWQQHLRVTAHAVDGFLEIAITQFSAPDCTTAYLSTLANQQISIVKLKLLLICLIKIHLIQVSQIERKPLDIGIRQILSLP